MNKIILSVIFSVISLYAFGQTNYYVSTSGDNNTNNGSITSPWLTIQYACDQLQAGDTLNIMAGIYPEKIDINVSGTPTSYITIQNYQNDLVILDAINYNDNLPIIWTDNAYLIIKGLHLTNNIHNYAGGLALQGQAHDIKIIDNKISNIRFSANPNETVTPNKNAVPLSVYADHPTDSIYNILIKGNEVFNNQSGYSENISVGGNLSNFEIVDNVVHDNTNIGIDVGGNYGTCPTPALDHGRNGFIRNNIVYNCNSPYSTAAGIYIDGGRNIIVENNISYHNGYGGEIGCEEDGTTENIVFRNNIFYQNEFTGMHVGGYDVNTTGIVINTTVSGNTFYHNDTGNYQHGEMVFTKLDNCSIENNIFYLSSQNQFLYFDRSQTNLHLNYNLVYSDAGSNEIIVSGTINATGLQSFYNMTGYGANSLYGNPNFNNPLNADFHILSDSPAIDAGNPSYFASSGEVDMDGQLRIFNNIIDCGADEYGSTTGFNIVKENTLVFYPNPSNRILYIKGISSFNYKIFDTKGQLIKMRNNNSSSIDLENLKDGLYFIKILDSTNKKVSVIKVIKK